MLCDPDAFTVNELLELVEHLQGTSQAIFNELVLVLVLLVLLEEVLQQLHLGPEGRDDLRHIDLSAALLLVRGVVALSIAIFLISLSCSLISDLVPSRLVLICTLS